MVGKGNAFLEEKSKNGAEVSKFPQVRWWLPSQLAGEQAAQGQLVLSLVSNFSQAAVVYCERAVDSLHLNGSKLKDKCGTFNVYLL